jgi:hypothetical protein
LKSSRRICYTETVSWADRLSSFLPSDTWFGSADIG